MKVHTTKPPKTHTHTEIILQMRKTYLHTSTFTEKITRNQKNLIKKIKKRLQRFVSKIALWPLRYFWMPFINLSYCQMNDGSRNIIINIQVYHNYRLS